MRYELHNHLSTTTITGYSRWADVYSEDLMAELFSGSASSLGLSCLTWPVDNQV